MCFFMFFLPNWPAPQKGSHQIQKFSISISISQLIFIDISISAISMTALVGGGGGGGGVRLDVIEELKFLGKFTKKK